MTKNKKIMIIGLDCATPELIFNRWLDKLPYTKFLIERGTYGELESCIPPITVPAWTCMMTSKNPGKLGFYGFRNRSDYSYNNLTFATSNLVKEDTLWDILSRVGKKVVLVGIPQTYPPKPVNGYMISCFLTPDTNCQYTYPPDFRNEVEALVGNYILDVEEFRTEDKEQLLKEIYEMTEKRFKVVKHLIRYKKWDFFMMVEMGVDRIYHGFWKYSDPLHRKYEAGNRYENAILEYHKYLDQEIGEILSLIDDETLVMIVSDHGAQRMEGGICVNEWLIREGYLRLLEKPEGIVPLGKTKIDWPHTLAWGEGGYYSRIFLNVKGREPQGAIEKGEYERVREELKEKLESITDEEGRNIGTRVLKPDEIYPVTNGIPPDLIVYFGNLRWRSVGSIGFNTIHTFENDTGPDDANHAEKGIFIFYNPQKGKAKNSLQLSEISIYDIAPTILHLLDIKVPPDMEGRVISQVNMI